MKLYDLTNLFLETERLLNEAETEEEFLAWKEQLTNVEAGIDEKIENMTYLVKNLEAEKQALKEEAKRLDEKAKRTDKKIENIKNYMMDNLKVMGLERIKYPTFTVSIRLNPPSVEVEDESILPKEYFIEQAPKLSKALLKDDLKNGLYIEGARLVRKESLQIK